MADNENLGNAKKGKNDEFYTSYEDIQKEMNAYIEYNPDTFKDKIILLPCDDPEWSNFTKFFAQNFEMLGLKKLISTSYATASKNKNSKGYQFNLGDFLTDFEFKDKKFNKDKSLNKGKIFILERDKNGNGVIDIDDLEWDYLEGDGDFRSKEVTKLRDEADIIITNPPFSLFRDFLNWILDGNKDFSIIGNQNAITFREVFPYLLNNSMWLGSSIHSGDREFRVPDSYPLTAAGNRIDENGNKYVRVKGVRWFTNLEHGRRHLPLQLMTMDDNIKYSKHKNVKGGKYLKYINYDAIDVPYTDAIPSDYDGAMGVPITFMDKYNPEQFEILGIDGGDMGYDYGVSNNLTADECKALFKEHKGFRKGKLCYRDNDGKLQVCYRRILIKKRG